MNISCDVSIIADNYGLAGIKKEKTLKKTPKYKLR